MSFKDKIMNITISHPKIATLGIGLAITFSISLVLGATDFQQTHALVAPLKCKY